MATGLGFLHTANFDQAWDALGLTDDDLRQLQNEISAAPTGAPLVKGSGGLRKARFSPVRENRGKSGSYRVGYSYVVLAGLIVLVAVWSKNQKSDLSLAEVKATAEFLKRLENGLKAERERS